MSIQVADILDDGSRKVIDVTFAIGIIDLGEFVIRAKNTIDNPEMRFVKQIKARKVDSNLGDGALIEYAASRVGVVRRIHRQTLFIHQ